MAPEIPDQPRDAARVVAVRLRTALSPGAAVLDVAAAASGLEELARRSAEGDAAVDRYYQAMLLELNERSDLATRQTRQWLVERAFTIEEQYIALDEHERLRPDEFLAKMQQAIQDTTRYSRALSDHMFRGTPSLDDLKLFVLHQWYRSRSGYRIIGDFASGLDCTVAGPFYRNVYDECGGDDVSPPHPLLMRKLLDHLDLPSEGMPTWVEAHTYLNNRVRCVRNAQIGQGLALMWYLEAVTSTSYLKMIEVFRRFDIPEDAYEFYTLHAQLDLEHTEQVESSFGALLDGAEVQASFVSTLRRHRELQAIYYDRIAASMGPESSRSALAEIETDYLGSFALGSLAS
jgi:hypothetical protein